jgi:hypothetical protein
LYASFVRANRFTKLNFLNSNSKQLELEVGRVLGRGAFCVVSEIDKLTLSADSSDRDDATEKSSLKSSFLSLPYESQQSVILQDRLFMERNCIRGRNKDRRYAVKRLQTSTISNTSTCITGIADLALEAKFLSVLCHPNLIKMRAVAKCCQFDKEFFIVLDRLHDTLPKRITQWKLEKPKGISKVFDRRGRKAEELWNTRISFARDLASALTYMHQSK